MERQWSCLNHRLSVENVNKTEVSRVQVQRSVYPPWPPSSLWLCNVIELPHLLKKHYVIVASADDVIYNYYTTCWLKELDNIFIRNTTQHNTTVDLKASTSSCVVIFKRGSDWSVRHEYYTARFSFNGILLIYFRVLPEQNIHKLQNWLWMGFSNVNINV